ncbi:hypothetical protein FWF74_00745, partial [Candidatus Saccharibacteria bacterium]|nr:hypothetical protein [Candidatus Saccharibacteria bacterium]
MVKEGNKNLPPARDVPIKPVKVIGNTMGGISIGGIGAGLGFWHEMCLTEVGTAMHNFAGTLTNFAGNADEHVGKLLEKMVTLPIDPIKFGIGVTAAAAVFLNRREISLAIRKVFDKAARKHVERVATSKEDAAWEAYQEKTRTAIQNGTGNETDVYRDLPEEQKDLVNAWRKRHKQPSATERSNPASPERSDRDTFNYWLNQFNNEAQQFDAVFLRARQQQGVGVNPRVDAIMASLHRASYFFDQLSKAHQNVRDINDSLKTTFDTAFMKYQDMVSRSQVFTGILSNRADRERYPYATMPRLYNSTGEIRPEDLDRLSNGYQAGRRLAYEQKHFSFDQLSQTIRNGNQYSQQDVNMVIDRLYRDGIIDYEGGNGYKLADSQNQVGLHQPEQPPPLAQTEPDNLSDKDRLKAARKQLRARERAITKQQNKEAWQSFGDDLLTLINIPQHVKYVFYDLPKNLIDSHQTDLVKEYTDVPKEYMRTYESMSARADETSLGRTYWNLCDLKYRENTQYTVVLSKAGLLPGTIKMLKEMHDTMVSFHRDAIYKYNELRKYIRDTARRSVAGGYQPPQYQGYPEGYQGYPEGYQGYYAGYPGQYQPQHPPYPPTTPEFTHPPESFNS